MVANKVSDTIMWPHRNGSGTCNGTQACSVCRPLDLLWTGEVWARVVRGRSFWNLAVLAVLTPVDSSEDYASADESFALAIKVRLYR